jgi:hypothetical protein
LQAGAVVVIVGNSTTVKVGYVKTKETTD